MAMPADPLSSIINGAAGSALHKKGTTIQTLALSVAAGFVLFGVQFGAFLILRNYLWAKRIYQPRSFLIPLKNRVKPPPNNPFRWIATLLKTSSETVRHKAGMDAYFFLRYLSLCLKIFGPAAVIILPILLPLNYVGGTGSKPGAANNVTGLDTLAWSNVASNHTSRYWAHLILAVLVIIWASFLFYHELLHYVVKRQEYLSSPSHRLKASSTTVLITRIPGDLCTTKSLMDLYDDFPGGVRRIWLNRNFESIVRKDGVRRQLDCCLENAETNLIRKVIKLHRRKMHQDKKNMAANDRSSSAGQETTIAATIRANDRPGTAKDLPGRTIQTDCEDDLQHDLKTKALWTQYISPKQREHMRIPKLHGAGAAKIPLIGRFFSLKVDTIYYCRRELARLNREIETEIEDADKYPQNASAFIQFNTQKGAHMACQSVADTTPGCMTHRMVELSPADINWPALSLTWQSRALRLAIFIVLFVVLVFAFGLISFFTGILSKVSTLADSTSWLRWISKLPRWLLSFIQGTLPPFIQVLVLSGPTPIVLRAMTNTIRGATTGSEGERSLQLWYFILLIFELFIVPTISSGLTGIVKDIIHNTASVPEILATNLPTAANYYFSFLVLQALSISSSSILQTVRLLNYYVFGSVNTAHGVYHKLSFTWRTRIGSNIPWYTTFAVIGLVYSVIAPLMLAFMMLTFSLFYIVIKNNMLYVVRTGDVDSGGIWFPSAINQTFTGIYFLEVCMIGLFFLVRDTQGKVSCEAQGIVMAVAFVVTVCYQVWLALHFEGLYNYAPLRLEGEAQVRDREYEATRLTSDRSPDCPTGRDTAVEPNYNANANANSNSNGQEQPDAVADEKKTDLKSSNISSVPDSQQLQNAVLQSRRPTMLSEHRAASLRSLSTNGLSRLSTNVDAQREHDKREAKKIITRLNRPLDESRLAELESHLAQTEARIGNMLIPRQHEVEAQMFNDPISKIIMQHNDELEDLTKEERDLLISVAFTHPVLRQAKPSAWIPRDDLGVSDDEVRRTRELMHRDVAIDNRGAFFNKKLKVKVDKPPPDMSAFAWVMAEL